MKFHIPKGCVAKYANINKQRKRSLNDVTICWAAYEIGAGCTKSG